MARSKRLASAGRIYHIVNRGNDRRVIFLERDDYVRFRAILDEGRRRFNVEIFGLCLMPNHFHALVRPHTDEALSAYMQWVQCRYACYLRRRTQTLGHGHVFQRRFWSALIVDDEHFRIVLRYIENNPVRACLVSRAQQWEWSSLIERERRGTLISPVPFDLPDSWEALVNIVPPQGILHRIREELKSTRRRKQQRTT
jgi:REP-associated tyrosine transposase